MIIKIRTFVILSALTLLLLGAFWFNQTMSLPSPAADLPLLRSDGLQQTLKDFQGKPVLITFWSTQCAICLKEVDELNQLYRQLDGSNSFELLAFSMYYDRPDHVVNTRDRMNMQYPVYFDLDKQLSREFGNVVATPTTFLLDRDGKAVYRHQGAIDFALIKHKITQLKG